MVALFAFMALLGPVMAWQGDPRITTPADFWSAAVMTLMFGVPTLVGAGFLIRCRITADARGLIFRGFHRTRRVNWAQIEDFEWRAMGKNEVKRPGEHLGTAYLQIGGKWHRITQIYTRYDALQERIAAGATLSRARLWQHADLREDGDWPKVFEYRDESGWRIFGQYLGISFALFAAHTLQDASNGWANFVATATLMWQVSPPWDRLGMVAMLVFSNGAIPILILTRFPAVLARRPYLGQKIIATHQALTLFKNARQVSIAWDEIESYALEALPGHLQPAKCVVEGGGRRIEFVTGISDTKSLRALIQNRAHNAQNTQWLHLNGGDDDVLGGAASLYPCGEVGQGLKIYHYRTRSGRAVLALGAVMSALILLAPGSRILHGRSLALDSLADLLGMMLFLGPIIVATVLGAKGYFCSWLACEAGGLRQKGLWGERFLAWDEIHKLAYNGTYAIVSGATRKIRIGLIADYQGLCAEIERRAGVECKRDGNAF